MRRLANYFETVSYGGMELRDREVKKFDTLENAIAEADANTWNTDYHFYKVVMNVYKDGHIEEKKTELKNVVGGGRKGKVAIE
jgi:hypothetical protein